MLYVNDNYSAGMIVTVFSASFHLTSAPRFSATNLIGRYVLEFSINAGESSSTVSLFTNATAEPINIMISIPSLIIVTLSVSSSHLTSAPSASAINLMGSIVLSFLITGATSLVTDSPNTFATTLSIVRIKGKRSTKTVFIAEKLQCLVNEFCIEKELKIGDVIEHALIQYLNQNGYASKLEPILKNIEVFG